MLEPLDAQKETFTVSFYFESEMVFISRIMQHKPLVSFFHITKPALGSKV